MRVARASLISTGLGLGLVGAWYLLESGLDNIVQAAIWLAAGVFLHDAVWAPAVLIVVVIGARLLPPWARAAVTVGSVVLATVTLLAIPVLGRFGARPDNTSLLDRDYTWGWLVLAGVVAVGVTVGAASSLVHSRRRTSGQPDDTASRRPRLWI